LLVSPFQRELTPQQLKTLLKVGNRHAAAIFDSRPSRPEDRTVGEKADAKRWGKGIPLAEEELGACHDKRSPLQRELKPGSVVCTFAEEKPCRERELDGGAGSQGEAELGGGGYVPGDLDRR